MWIRDDETRKTRSSEGDDEHAAMHACAWSRGRRASDETLMTRTRHFGEDEGRAASQREEARLCGLGTKCARDEAVPEVGAWTTTMTEAVPDQIWVRARTTVADLDLRVALGWERHELVHRQRRQERCTCVEVVLEAMRSSGGAVALGEEQEIMEGEREEVVYKGTFSPG